MVTPLNRAENSLRDHFSKGSGVLSSTGLVYSFPPDWGLGFITQIMDRVVNDGDLSRFFRLDNHCLYDDFYLEFDAKIYQEQILPILVEKVMAVVASNGLKEVDQEHVKLCLQGSNRKDPKLHDACRIVEDFEKPLRDRVALARGLIKDIIPHVLQLRMNIDYTLHRTSGIAVPCKVISKYFESILESGVPIEGVEISDYSVTIEGVEFSDYYTTMLLTMICYIRIKGSNGTGEQS